MTMNKALYPREDVDRLNVSRKEGGRGLTSIEDSVDASIQRLEESIEKHWRRLENETYKIIWDFEIQTDHLISVRRPDLIIMKKKKMSWLIVDFAIPADYRVKLKENQNRDKNFDLARELKKTVEHENDNDTT